jgi:hypothetical protein
MHAFITGVAVWGPGLAGWEASVPVLARRRAYVAEDTPPPPPSILPATERRRAGVTVRLALTVAQQAMAMAGETIGGVRSVFGSGNGDGAVVHAILEELAMPDPQVSPTQFHNSVHNAAAGYWTIATASHQAATSLGCHDATFAAVMLKAVAELCVEGRPVMLCLYDAPFPEPLASVRPIAAAFGAGLVLVPEPNGRELMRIEIGYRAAPPDPAIEAPVQPALHALWRGNPAARALRLLEHIARGEAGVACAGLLDGRIDISMQPCQPSPHCMD